MELLEKAKRIELLSGKLGLMIPVTYLHIEHRDKDGILYPNGDYYNVAQSWVRNAYNHLLSRISGYYPRDTGNFGTGYISYKNYEGILVATGRCFGYWYSTDARDVETSTGYYGPVTDPYRSLTVSTDITAESFEDTSSLGILHGNGSGQLNFAATTVSESDAGLVHKASWSRVFTHNGNGQPNITVGSVGIHALVYYDAGSSHSLCFLRDVLSSSVTLTYLDTLTVTYEITLTYPS